PRMAPGQRSTDPADFPTGKEIYATRDLDRLRRMAADHGDAIGVYAAALLDTPLPWTKMRQVYRLLGLVKKLGAGRDEQAWRRDSASAGRRARVAKLDSSMMLEAWDDTAAITYDRAVWTELVSMRFVDQARNAFILGPVGVGKTFLATALGHIACRRRIGVHFERADRLHKRLRAARLDASYDVE